MTEQTQIIFVAVLALVFACLWIFNGRQKRRFEQERRERKRELERVKAKARSQNNRSQDERPKAKE